MEDGLESFSFELLEDDLDYYLFKANFSGCKEDNKITFTKKKKCIKKCK